jgi:hypothetical protein
MKRHRYSIIITLGKSEDENRGEKNKRKVTIFSRLGFYSMRPGSGKDSTDSIK